MQRTVPFSRRSAWPSQQNELTTLADSLRAQGVEILDLTLSNPTRAGMVYPPELLRPLASPSSLAYSPEPLGLASSREHLAAWYRARGQRRSAERTVLTASSSESYSHLFHLLADPGDEVLIPAPSYPLFSFLADLAGVRLRAYPLRYDGAWYIDLDALRAAVNERTRAILVVSPNNPTGSYVKDDEAAALRRLASERGLALISDEVFAEYPLERVAERSEQETSPPQPPSPWRAEGGAPQTNGRTALGPPRGRSLADEEGCLTFVLGGLSKLAGLPQLKLGWIFVSGPDAPVREALARLEIIADTYLSVGTPVQQALPSLLAASDLLGDQIRERTRRNLVALRRALAGAPATVLDVEGGWYAVLQLPATRSEAEWTAALLRVGVQIHPGHFFDFPREPFAVLSLLPTPEDFDEGLRRLLRGMDAI
jgi:aspartate/methionine/tyrosine aminotransferase